MKTEEVDAVLQREDLRLAVQPKAERLDVRLDLLEYLPEQQLVAVDDVEVVHVPAIGSHGLGAGASLGSVGRPEDAVAERDALVVEQGAAELAGDGLGDSGTASEALVVAPDPVTGVTRRRPA